MISSADNQISTLADNWDSLDIEFSFPDTDTSAYAITKSGGKTPAPAVKPATKDTDSISTFASNQPRSVSRVRVSSAQSSLETPSQQSGQQSSLVRAANLSSTDTVNSDTSFNSLASRLSMVETSLEGYTSSIQSEIRNLSHMVSLLYQGSQNSQPQQPGQVPLDSGNDAGSSNAAGAGSA